MVVHLHITIAAEYMQYLLGNNHYIVVEPNLEKLRGKLRGELGGKYIEKPWRKQCDSLKETWEGFKETWEVLKHGRAWGETWESVKELWGC